MNKAQKRLVSALAAASSVAAVIAPAATVFAATKDEAAALVAEAKKTLAFVDYNQAYAAIMALPAADQPALLAALAPLAEKAITSDVTDVLKQMEAMAKTWDLDNYYKVEKIINETVKLPRNQQYLMGELTSWGKKAVFTADVVAATDAIIKAWTDKTPASVAAAKEAAAKVTNAGSLAWLNTEIATINNAVPLAVSSVTANSAKSFTVKFNKAVEDTTKVTFDVKKYTTPVTPTIAWSIDKTEATLTNASNLSEGEYAVAVKNDTVDLGTSKVTISAQKVAKIEITSSKLAVTNTKVDGKYVAYATYKVLDQYGTDITSTYLANSLTFQTGVGTVEPPKDGRLTIKSELTLMQFSSVVITGYDSTTGVSTTATLATSTAVGTLNGIELKELTNADKKVLTANDDTTVFYISYSAMDMSDNVTKDYTLVHDGLILSGDNKDELTVSAPSYISAKVVQDPTDSKKAAIEVRAKKATISMDLPVTITAMTYTGKTSSLNLTLKKQAAVDTFTLMAPAYDIAVNEVKEVPFVAYDQNGTQVTKYSDLTNAENKISFSDEGRMKFVENSDGTARLEVGSWGTNGQQILTAVTKTGKMSSLTLNIQKTAIADSLEVSNTKIQYLQAPTELADGSKTYANQTYDFWDAGGLTVKDQYGRAMDMKTTARNGYTVVASTTSSNVQLYQTSYGTDNFATTTPAAFGGKNAIKVRAIAPGSATVVFTLKDAAGKDLSTKSLTFTVVKADDVTGYVLDTPATQYAAADVSATTPGAVTARQKEYKIEPDLFGTLSNGTKVKLSKKLIKGVFVDNTKDFIVQDADVYATTPGAFDAVAVYAKDLDNNRTTATANLTVTFEALDGKVKSVTTPITSSTAKPVAASVGIGVGNAIKNADGKTACYIDGETIYVKIGALDALNMKLNSYMVKFMPEDVKQVSEIAFNAKDQYGETAMKLSYVGFADSTVAANKVDPAGFAVDSTGKITAVDATKLGNNDEIYLTAVAGNGQSKTVKIVFVTSFGWEN